MIPHSIRSLYQLILVHGYYVSYTRGLKIIGLSHPTELQLAGVEVKLCEHRKD